MRRTASRLLLILVALGASALGLRAWVRGRGGGPHLRDVGPRLVSNQTRQPLALYGEGFSPGMRLLLGAPFSRELPVTVLDGRHAYVRLPADLWLPPRTPQQEISLALRSGPGEGTSGVQLTVVNDAAFPDLTALASSGDGRFVFAASQTTDTVFAIEPATRKVTPLKVADGPTALAPWRDPHGTEWLVVAHAFSPELRLLRFDGSAVEQRSLPAPAYAAGLLVDSERGTAYIAEHATDTVTALRLDEGGRILWTTKVHPNPRAMAFAGGALVVGSLQTAELQLLDRASGQVTSGAHPVPGTPIIGGRTEGYSAYVMGGKAPRALAYSPRSGCLLASGIGPNTGPNPDRMEVSANGGISVVSVEGGLRFVRHVGFGGGVPEGLALDDRAGLLYSADIGIGRVRVVDVRSLCAPLEGGAASGGPEERIRHAVVQELPIPPPAGFPTVRSPADFDVRGRAGLELHSGPRALALSPDARTLYALDRFSGTLAVIDVSAAARGQAVVTAQIPIVETLGQRERRLGQVLYHADLGRSGMSCDTCHLDGHGEGVFFEKTRPMRIYRSTTLRASRETPPYFNPASTWSLGHTMQDVGDRNRFHNPNLTHQEIDNLALYSAAITLLPNPFVGEDGAPVSSLPLPDGARGDPRQGLKLFEGAAGCAACHPAPHFTTDQDPATRGRIYNVGTPAALPLRVSLQQLLPPEFGPPSLLGAWDIFPMLTSGAGGLGVDPAGTLEVRSTFPLREVVEAGATSKPPHGNTAGLSPQQRNDLLAYLLSL